MKLTLAVFAFSLFSIFAVGAFADDDELVMIPQNPLASASEVVNAPKAVTKIRFINHGLKVSEADLNAMIEAAEKSFSQCGVNFKLETVSEINSPATTLQDHLETPDNEGRSLLTQDFFSFYSSWVGSREPRVIDVHLVDHLDSQSRDAQKHHRKITGGFEGKTFVSLNMQSLYIDTRPLNERSPNIVTLGGDTMLLAMETARLNSGHLTKILDSQTHRHVETIWKSYATYLLAHELGHVVLETQDGEQGYVDHLCPALGTTCPRAFLMSSGGYDERRYLNPKKDKEIIGYSPLPRIDTAQCARLKSHPLVQLSN